MTYEAYIEAHQKEFLNDLNTLVSIESVYDDSTAAIHQPFGKNCRAVLDAMLHIACRDGFSTRDIDGYAGVVEYGKQDQTFGVLGHLDIVPIGTDWTKDPLSVTENDGYIFGRGVLDDKGPTLAAYYAIRMIRDLHIPLRKRLMFIAGCDEESGMKCMKYYKTHAEIPQMGFVPDADFPVIYGEKGCLRVDLTAAKATVIRSLHAGDRTNIVIGKADCEIPAITEEQERLFHFYCTSNALKGKIQKTTGGVLLHIDGIASHGANPYNGVNAALHLLNFIGSAYCDPLAKDLYMLLSDWKGSGLEIQMNGVYMGFLTVNVGIVDIENDHTCVKLDIRYPNDIDEKALMNKIIHACKPTCVQAEYKEHSKPLFVDPQSRLVQDLLRVYQKYTKDTFSRPTAIGGGTYARQFDHFVSYGPALPRQEVQTDQFVGGCHQRDEGIKLDQLLQAIAIYADAIVTVCS